jgi:hypothetical protein
VHHDDTAEMIGTLMTFSPMGVFATASMLIKLAIIVILAAGVVALIAAIARRLSGGPRSGLLALAGQIGLYAGLAGAGYIGMTAFMAAQQTHMTRFVVYEPDAIEAVFVLGLGVIVYLIARAGNAGAKRT